VGYYYIAPGRKPRLEYGVATDLDILQIASDYFGMRLQRRATRLLRGPAAVCFPRVTENLRVRHVTDLL